MNTNFFVTGDHHFGHKNIIQFCNRPFADVESMNQALIYSWNKTVGEQDVVYHLGDFTLSGTHSAMWYFGQLNGMIYILNNSWHHDKRWLKDVERGRAKPRSASGQLITLAPPIITIPTDLGHIVLCHYPFAAWDRKHHGAFHLHAHSHGTHSAEGRIFDAGVDSVARMTGEYRPIRVDDAVKLAMDNESFWIRNKELKR